MPEGGQKFLSLSLQQFVRAITTIDDFDMPAEIRQAIDTAFRAVFQIGTFKGSHDTIVFERRFGPSERGSHTAAGRKSISEAQCRKIENICAENGWTPDQHGVAKQVVRTGKVHLSIGRVRVHLKTIASRKRTS